MTGLAAHRHPRLYEPERYERFAEFLAGVREYGVEADVFYVVDVSTHDNGRVNGREFDAAAAREARLDSHVFDPMLERIRRVASSVSFEAYEAPPLCETRPCLCRSNMTYPRWWEQVAKNERCWQLVQQAEARRRVRYNWVLKARSEYRWRGLLNGDTRRQGHPKAGDDYDGISVDAFLHMANACPACTWVSIYNGEQCYAMMDWAAVMPRSQPAFMTIAAAPCAWADEQAARFLAMGWVPGATTSPTLKCQTNERWLGQWMHDAMRNDTETTFRVIPEPNRLNRLGPRNSLCRGQQKANTPVAQFLEGAAAHFPIIVG